MPTRPTSDKNPKTKAPQTKDYEAGPGLGRANVDRDEQGRASSKEDPVEVRPGQKKGAVPAKRRSTPSAPSQ